MSFFKKVSLAVSLSILALLTASFLFIADPSQNETAQASEAQNVIGHAWSENVGWVSFNCMNQHQLCANNRTVLCSLDSDCIAAGVGGTCMNECSTSNYGVNVSESGGPFSGYAWSSNVGWIDFAPVGPYPSTPSTAATYNAGTGVVTGWAKIVNLGDDGWLKLSGTWTSGVAINSLTFTGWAWNGNTSGTGIGWLSFNCADSGAGGCSSSNYKVMLNKAPSAMNLTKVSSVLCEYPGPKQDPRQPVLRWTFSDQNSGDTQGAYELVLSANPAFTSPLINTGKVLNSAAAQYAVSSGDGLQYNTTYYWRVRLWDNHNFASSWTSASFTVEKHSYPDIISITTNPTNPRALENVFFSGVVKTYGNSSVAANAWVFSSTATMPASVATSTASAVVIGSDAGGNIIQSTTQGAGPMQFQSTGGGKEVTLTVTDTDGYSCEKPLSVSTSISLPIWEEIKPQ
jgi:hypothetical protein